MEKDHEEARRIAEESMVLLKNDDTDPPSERRPRKLLSSAASPKSLVSRAAEALISTASRSPTHWIPFLPMHRLLMQKASLQTKISMMTPLLQKLSKQQKRPIRLLSLPDFLTAFESEGYDRSHMRLPECQNRLITEILKVQPNAVDCPSQRFPCGNAMAF